MIGSGFGGAMAAWPLVQAGKDVLMIERGSWVAPGPGRWLPEGTITRTPHYRTENHYLARTDRGLKETTACSCVGGPSTFYGGVSLRFREADFLPAPEITADSGACWPIGYDDLRPFYAEAERILGVAGLAGDDPTEPRRSEAYGAPPSSLSEVSRVIAEAARAMGLNPFRLPLAINHEAKGNRSACVACATCDTFACAVEAKNDLATAVIPALLALGMDLCPETVVTRLDAPDGRIEAVEVGNRRTGTVRRVTADTVVLAAGALGSPHLVLASGLERANPAGELVGRYLTRHCSGIVFGLYPWLPRHEGRFHKQIGINDYYFGDRNGGQVVGKLGHIQQTQTPSIGSVIGEIGQVPSFFLKPFVRRITGLLVIAEDRPRHRNRAFVDTSDEDSHGLPRLRIKHRYDRRDLEARRTLARHARRIHRKAGALATGLLKIDTFSHALGTMRMGDDPELAPVDRNGRFRGVDNLYVADGSTLPRSAGVNPSLTIAANALRIGQRLAEPVTKAVQPRAQAQ